MCSVLYIYITRVEKVIFFFIMYIDFKCYLYKGFTIFNKIFVLHTNLVSIRSIKQYYCHIITELHYHVCFSEF